jgi:hypothetical protein
MSRRLRTPIGVERVCQQCGATWLQTDGKPPRDYCSTTCRQEATGQQPRAASEDPPLPTRVRVVRARLVAITCQWCRDQVVLEQFPGPTPRYCSALCRQAAARDGAAARMQRLRERRRAAQGGGAPETAQA